MFQTALGLRGIQMNAENVGVSNTVCSKKRTSYDWGKYSVPISNSGKSFLTSGVKYPNKGGEKRFTCVELEVFALK